MYGDNRTLPGQTEPVRQTATDHQCPNETWPRGISDRAWLLDTGTTKHILDQRQQSANVVPRRNLGDDAAIDLVQVDLAVQRLAHEPTFGVE